MKRPIQSAFTGDGDKLEGRLYLIGRRLYTKDGAEYALILPEGAKDDRTYTIVYQFDDCEEDGWRSFKAAVHAARYEYAQGAHTETELAREYYEHQWEEYAPTDD